MERFPFSQYLFWDADINTISLQKNRRYIVERVITRGSIEDFKKLLSIYSKNEIIHELKKVKDLDPKTRHFCSWYFNIPINDLHASSFYH
jgi:hypothetical protein